MVKFLELETMPDPGRGWLLLKSLNYLSSTNGSEVIEAMSAASLPSTLVKCLYLFYDLPATSDRSELPRLLRRDSQLAPLQRRTILQELFMEVIN